MPAYCIQQRTSRTATVRPTPAESITDRRATPLARHPLPKPPALPPSHPAAAPPPRYHPNSSIVNSQSSIPLAYRMILKYKLRVTNYEVLKSGRRKPAEF